MIGEGASAPSSFTVTYTDNINALLSQLADDSSDDVERQLQFHNVNDIVAVIAKRLLDVEESPSPFVFSHEGDAVVGAGTFRWPVPGDIQITSVVATADTAPSGADLVFDVNKNGTTIFTTQENRPSIPAGGHETVSEAVPDVIQAAEGDYLTVDIDQVGSSIAGANLVVVITGQAG